jgi:hypothetical protein
MPQFPDSSKLEEESKYLAEQVRKQAAGRVCWESREEWETGYKRIEEYYKEKREFEAILNGPRPILRGRMASERLPFL